MSEALTFSTARERALALDAHLEAIRGAQRLWIRDLYGRITLYTRGLPRDAVDEVEGRLRTELGRYAGEPPVLRIEELPFSGDALFQSEGREPIADDASSHFLERYVTGSDWLGEPLANEAPTPPRAVLFGLKGGVGRSTALAFWARYLAERGKKVLVVDLDLEAPGLGSMLLRPEARLRYGLVDWFVESAVGESDAVIADLLVRSELGRDTDGSIIVAPASGRDEHGYLRKLNRVYLDTPGAEAPLRFADRLAMLVDELERVSEPDVVLIDSRSGLQDTAAVALTRLGAQNFLFAVETPQTWEGYAHLFGHWKLLSQLHRDAFESLRQRTRVVAGQIPEVGGPAYVERFIAHSHALFSEYLYDESEPNELADFAFDISAEEAPHQPIPIRWHRALQDYDPFRREGVVTPEQVKLAFGDFFERATYLLLDNPED